MPLSPPTSSPSLIDFPSLQTIHFLSLFVHLSPSSIVEIVPLPVSRPWIFHVGTLFIVITLNCKDFKLSCLLLVPFFSLSFLVLGFLPSTSTSYLCSDVNFSIKTCQFFLCFCPLFLPLSSIILLFLFPKASSNFSPSFPFFFHRPSWIAVHPEMIEALISFDGSCSIVRAVAFYWFQASPLFFPNKFIIIFNEHPW